ncbi:MAG: fumarate hydratase [Firmicutes bacterium]|nr:fumarate hydratase [Bacillota bacterium]
MREIHVDQITGAVREMCMQACYDLPEDVAAALTAAREREESELGREILGELQENIAIARERRVAICQDTGITVVFVKLGQDVRIVGGSFNSAINEGVRRGYTEGYLRKSVVCDPLERKNTGDNTPAVIHIEVVPGDGLHLTVAPKGIGSENMSGVKMLVPALGSQGVIDFIYEVVERAGPNPCPPIVVGVGIGGTMEKAAILAKKALFRPLGQPHSLPHIAELEQKSLERINNSGIGPMGLGGRTTALAVQAEVYPTHIGGLPVAVNIQCHACRHAEKEL